MSPRHGRHTKVTSRRGGRHASLSPQAQPLSLAPRQGRPGVVSGPRRWRRVCAAGHSLRRRPGQPGQCRRGGSRCGDDRRPPRFDHLGPRRGYPPGLHRDLWRYPVGHQRPVLRDAGRLPGLRQPRPDLYRAGHHSCLRRYRGCFCFPCPPGPRASSPALAQQPQRLAAGVVGTACRLGGACENGTPGQRHGWLPRKDRTGYAS
jgi:hypothetical protein